jgi:polyhydroxyalkanoate synthesis regulator phasin
MMEGNGDYPSSSTPSQELDMVDLIKKAIYTGVGLAVLTKEKAEELVKELSQQAKLSEQEGKELFDSLLKQSEHARNDLQSKVDEAVVAVVNRLNLATKDELAGLKTKVEELSSKLGQGSGTSTGA